MRELRVDDGEAVAALIKDANPHRQVDAEEVRSWLRQPWLDADDLRVVDDGDVVGYIDLDLRGDIAYLDPSGPGREDELLEWGERRARERGAAKVRLPIWEGQDALGEVATRRGYSRVRASFELLLELGDEPLAGPAWPDGIEVRTYRHPEDEQRTYETQEEAFRDAWDYDPLTLEQWQHFELGRRGFDPSLWFLAWDGAELAATCLVFPNCIDDEGLAWISILGVRRPWRKRGLGEALLRHAFRELHARGIRRVGLGVDAESPTGATRLYERVGMRVAVRSEAWDKPL